MKGFFFLACVGLAALTADASAQRRPPDRQSAGERGARSGILPPYAVVRRLAKRGWHSFRALEFRDGRYVVRARKGRDRPRRVIVDAGTGKVID